MEQFHWFTYRPEFVFLNFSRINVFEWKWTSCPFGWKHIQPTWLSLFLGPWLWCKYDLTELFPNLPHGIEHLCVRISNGSYRGKKRKRVSECCPSLRFCCAFLPKYLTNGLILLTDVFSLQYYNPRSLIGWFYGSKYSDWFNAAAFMEISIRDWLLCCFLWVQLYPTAFFLKEDRNRTNYVSPTQIFIPIAGYCYG